MSDVDEAARQLGEWLEDTVARARDAARTFLSANPTHRTVGIQPTIMMPDGEVRDLGDPLVFDRKGLGL